MNQDGKDKLRIAFLRHGPTDWNEQGRIQGRIDMPLSAGGTRQDGRTVATGGVSNRRALTSARSFARARPQSCWVLPTQSSTRG